MILGAETFRQEDSASRRRKAEQTKRSRQRQKEKRLLELERKRERNKTIISYRDQQVVNMEEEEEEREEREAPSTPAFKVGEVVSIKGDTTERGYASLFIYFLRHASYFRR